MGLIRRGWGLVCKGAMVLNKMKAISISSCDKEAQEDWAVYKNLAAGVVPIANALCPHPFLLDSGQVHQQQMA